jgi:hypothetical protein
MEELFQFVCAQCGNSVEVAPPKISIAGDRKANKWRRRNVMF